MVLTATPPRYPVHVEAHLDRPLSRWLWLVKWVLAIPHYVILAFLWAAFVVLTAVAFVAILFTGRYPRAIFDFNVGVLRWSWRVTYYSWGALGTDQYPPFTLADVPDYPARLDIDPPERLSRGLVLVKWWLLALPHYVITAFFVGGGTWLALDRTHDAQWQWGGGGLVGVLVMVCAVVLLFTGRYPQPLFDLILGMQRWVLRVCAYAALMTDAYPPFRLDLGGPDPDGVLAFTGPGGRRGSAGTAVETAPPPESAIGPVAPAPPTAPPIGPAPGRWHWTGGRVASVVLGSVLALTAGGLLIGGTAVAVADLSQRDSAGYLVSPKVALDTGGYAIRTESVRFTDLTPATADSLLGTVRIRVTPVEPSRQVFVGIAPTDAVDHYLTGVDHVSLTGFTNGRPIYTLQTGGAPAVPPPAAGIWAAQASGPGTVDLTWKVRSGAWSVVVADASGRAGVQARTDVGATVPALGWLAFGLILGGAVLLGAGALLIGVPIARASAAFQRDAGAPRPSGPNGPGEPGGPGGVNGPPTT